MAMSNEDASAIAWLGQAVDDHEIEGLRDEVGRSVLGAHSDWYQHPDKLSELVDTLGPHSGLMFELHRVNSRQDQVDWLQKVVQSAQGAEAPQQQARYSEPTYDEGYRLYYRFDDEEQVYEWCADPHVPAPEWMSQSAADAMVAARTASHEAPQEHRAVAEQTGGAAEPSSAWDDGWGMFYRVGQTGVYEYSHSVDEAHTKPDGVWLSGEQVIQQRQQAAAGQAAGQTQTAHTGAGPTERMETSGGTPRGEHAEKAPSPAAAEPLDTEAALKAFDQAGVPALRAVVEDMEALFAGLTELGVA